jgi:nitrate reductase gamma subunit
MLGAIGVIGLLIRRITDSDVVPFSTFANIFNLLFLLSIYTTGAYAVFTVENYSAVMTAYVMALISANPGVVMPFAAALHVIPAALFLIYLPFTYMMHFVAKYFMYHEVRWNDDPMMGNTAMEEKVKALLGQPVSWAAPHIKGDGKKNWVDIATEEDKDEKKS